MPEVLDPYALTTLARVKAMLGITGSTHDDVLTRLINAVSAYIEKYVGRGILARDHDAYYPSEHGDSFLIPEFPINSVAALAIGTVGGTYTAYGAADENDDWSCDYKVGILYVHSTRFYTDVRGVHLQYNAGYAATPHDLEEMCIRLVVNRYQQGGTTSTHEVESERVGDYSVSYHFSDADLTDVDREILGMYRRCEPGWGRSA
jgi:uncharacterized phiE125 gp8 family phage protein